MTLSNKNFKIVNEILGEYKKSLNKEQKKIIAKKLIKYITDNYKNEKTITNKLSLIKKYSGKFKDKEFSSMIVPDKLITLKARKENTNMQENRKRLEVDKETIDKLLSFRNSNDLTELIFYLLFTLGRRISEILEGNVENKKKCKGLFFTGIKKLRKESDKNIEVCIEPIDTKTNVYKAYKKMKLKLKNVNINNLKRKLNRDIKKIDPEFKLHTLRSLYANYLFKYRNKENLNFNGFIKEKLNHKSLESSFGYNFINFKE